MGGTRWIQERQIASANKHITYAQVIRVTESMHAIINCGRHDLPLFFFYIILVFERSHVDRKSIRNHWTVATSSCAVIAGPTMSIVVDSNRRNGVKRLATNSELFAMSVDHIQLNCTFYLLALSFLGMLRHSLCMRYKDLYNI